MSDYSHILSEVKHGIATVTLNRPEVHNAFNDALIAEMTAVFAQLGADNSVRAVVIAGAGKSFCAGADLGWMERMANASHEENVEDARRLQRMFAAISHCPKATIARVHGVAIGGGAGLVAVCDIAVASESATFALSEVRLGLIPAVVAPYVLQKVGLGAARALFVTGERFGADEACRIGLVQKVVPADGLDAEIGRRTALLRDAGPNAVAAAKQLLQEIANLSPDDAGELTARRIAELRGSPEGREGVRAFLEKRKPEFGN